MSSATLQTPGPSPEPTVRSVGQKEDGMYACDQTDCTATFTKKCEWSKHMDKHDRPYSCKEPGCEKLKGFTYSGGLLRHEREVHKKHGSPKEAFMCPHSNCKRSSGAGFTRRGNLHEHLRRVHKEGDDKRHESVEEDEQSDLQSEGVGQKRKKSNASDRPNSPPALSEAGGLRVEVKRLKEENEGLLRELQRGYEELGNFLARKRASQ